MSAPVITLLAELRLSGIELSAVNGRIRYRPRAALTAELLARVSEHKTELLAMVSQKRSTALAPAYWDSVGYPSTALAQVDDQAACYCCKGTDWWRLKGSATEWFCATCAAPMSGIGEIEVRDA